MAKMLIIDNFSMVMPYNRCKLNKNATDRHYKIGIAKDFKRYLIEVLGIGKISCMSTVLNGVFSLQ